MNNDLSIRPAYLSDTARPGAFADTIGFAQPPRISMRDDRFNVIDENRAQVVPPSLNIDIIMLWENDTRIYYPKDTYDADAATPPTCYSDNRVTPSLGAIQPQSILCANCPHSVWDQPTPRGNLVPACDSRYKVACLVAGAGGRVFLLNVPPASRKGYEQYRRHLRAHHANPQDVITRLGYQDKAFTFEFNGWVSEKTVEFIRKVFETDEPALVVNAFDKPKETQALSPPVAASPADHVQQTATDWQPPLPPLPTEEPKRPRGRPPKDAQAGQAMSASLAASSTPASAPKGNGSGFGMESPQAPPVNIQEALDRAFGPR